MALISGLPISAAAQTAPAGTVGIGAAISRALSNTACAAGFCPTGGKPRTFVQILGAYTNGIIGFLGLIFLILIIWGGFKWMTAAGNEQQVEKAKGVVKNATIGLALILLARIITTLLLDIIEPAVIPS